MKMSLPLISFFCGAGGLDDGFRQAGFETLLAYDNSASAITTYNRNAGKTVAYQADLAKLNASEIKSKFETVSPEVKPIGVIGGPPCQGFSIGNVHANPRDPRNTLPFKYARILKELNSFYNLHFFVFENVMGLTLGKHSNRFRKIKRAFEQAGFRVFQKPLNAVDFGVAQNRHRLFLVGLNVNIYPNYEFLFPVGDTQKLTVRDVIEGLPCPTYFARGMKTSNNPCHPNHWTMAPKSSKFQTNSYTNGRSFKQLTWDSPSPTVAYGNREIHIHPDGGRRLSVYEAMLLQGFSEEYQLSGNLSEQVTQVSNAVPPPVARALAESLKTMIYAQRRSALVQLLAQTGVIHERPTSRERACTLD